MPVSRFVPEYPNYKASSDGKVYVKQMRKDPEDPSRKKLIWKELAQRPNRKGYLIVDVYFKVDGVTVKKSRPVHYMVLTAFKGPRPSRDHEARHYNGKNQDNRAKNLLWGTRQENMDDQRRLGTLVRGEKSLKAKLKEWQVKEIKRRLYKRDALTSNDMYEAIAKEYGVSIHAIHGISSGKTWAHVTFIKPYTTEEHITIRRHKKWQRT